MVNRSSNMLLSPFPGFKHIVLVLLLALGIAVPFASAQNKNAPQMSDRAAEDIGKLQPYIDAKNWGGAINLLNGMLRYAAPNSYDEALINDIVSKIYLQKGDYALSLSPLGKAYELGEGYSLPCPGGRRGLPSLCYGSHSNNQVGSKSIICNDNAFISP